MAEKAVIETSDYIGRVWQFNEDEEAAMEYLPHSDQVLYLRGMRKNMDFSTGTVGISRRISYQGFKELLEVNRSQGSTKSDYAPSRDAMRAMIARLVKVGLLERIQFKTGMRIEPLAFKLPLAHIGRYSALVKEPHYSTASAPPAQSSELVQPRANVSPAAENKVSPIHQSIRLNNNSTKVECENSNELSDSESNSSSEKKAKAVSQESGALGHCPWNEILDIWQAEFPARRQPNRNLWAKQAAAKDLRARWKEAAGIDHSNGSGKLYSDRESGLDFWQRFLKHLAKSKFLTSDESNFFDLQWLVTRKNFYKTLDGKYESA